MKLRYVLAVIAIFSFLINGCATQSIQQGKDLSSSGITYTVAVNNLLDVAVDRIIDFDTEELKRSRIGSDLRNHLIEKNTAVLDIISEIEVFRNQTNLLKSYFLNLQALADSSVKEDSGNAVKTLSDSISKLNNELGSKEIFSLSEDQKEQIGALGGLVANSIHAAKIKKALSRDAGIIGYYLGLQENQLKIIAGILRDRFSAENDLFLEEKIISPYIDKNKNLGTGWAADRKKWLKTNFINQQLATAQEAAKQLRGVWGDILQGKSDLNSLRTLISDVNEFITVSQSLKDAGESK